MKNKRINLLIIFSIILNIILTVTVAADNSDGEILLAILLPFTGISVIGVLMVLKGKLKWGYRLIIIGCVLFVPIGLIGVFGVIKAKKVIEEENFEKQRAENS